MNKKTKTYGRPPGKIKTAKIEIAIEPEIKEEFMDLLKDEGKKASIEIGIIKSVINRCYL